MLRKCTLKILPRSPNQRITSKISRARVVEHLGGGALAEIEAVTGALVHLHEAFQPLHSPQYTGHTAIAGPRVGVVRMAGQTHFGGGRDRHDGCEEPVDRSQFSSSDTTPAMLGGAAWSARL
jgi:hypothetical protein